MDGESSSGSRRARRTRVWASAGSPLRGLLQFIARSLRGSATRTWWPWFWSRWLAQRE